MTSAATVFVVDDDAPSRVAVSALARALGLAAAAYTSSEEFLASYREEPGCVVARLKMNGGGGVELLQELQRRDLGAAVIVVAVNPDTATVVRAMKAGAVTVLDKPLDEKQLGEAVREGLALDAERRVRRQEQAEFRGRLESLTDKEHEVLRMLMGGMANKAMASQLGASLRTVENRRRSVFNKLGVHSVAEMVARVLKSDEDAGAF